MFYLIGWQASENSISFMLCMYTVLYGMQILRYVSVCCFGCNLYTVYEIHVQSHVFNKESMNTSAMLLLY